MSRRLKYGNNITVAHGIKFRSKGEANRYCELLLLAMAGEIANIKLQVKRPLIFAGKTVSSFTSDFDYL